MFRYSLWNDTDRRRPSDRAQSETVGVIMLTAVIVVLVGGFGVVYLGVIDDRAGEGTPLVDANITATSERVTITHASGESVPFETLVVVVHTNGDEQRFAFDADNVTRPGTTGYDPGDRFDPGERFRRNYEGATGQIEVLLIHTPSNTELHRAYLDV